VEYVDLEDNLEVVYSVLNVDLALAYRIAGTSMFISAGPVLTVPFSPQWTQTETIIAPPDVQYAGGGNSKLLLDGDIPDVSTYLGLSFGAGALLPLSDVLSLCPELVYTLPLSDLQPDFKWSVSGLELCVAVMLRL
jgi:hypothetical protein